VAVHKGVKVIPKCAHLNDNMLPLLAWVVILLVAVGSIAFVRIRQPTLRTSIRTCPTACTNGFDRYPGRAGHYTDGFLGESAVSGEEECACRCKGRPTCGAYNYIEHAVPGDPNCGLYKGRDPHALMIIDPEAVHGRMAN
jgi:hypothetical protein